MIISWNVRGCNDIAKIREIGSRLFELNCAVAILVETRVKKDKSKKVRNNLGHRWHYIDNYDFHHNGRIWILWNPKQVEVRSVTGGTQFIHCGIYDLQGTLVTWMTTIYASNLLDDRRMLWTDIQNLHQQVQGC